MPGSRNLTANEVEQILVNLTCVRDRCLFVLGVYTGFRISELLSLKVSNVIQYGNVKESITIARSQMKGKRESRTIPLHSNAKLVLHEFLVTFHVNLSAINGNLLLFPFTRMQGHRILSKAVLKAGIEGKISTHSMRKTFGQRVYERTGKDVVAAQRALGHKSLASTSHYLSVGQDVVNAAIMEEE